jgi:hypothetical protein
MPLSVPSQQDEVPWERIRQTTGNGHDPNRLIGRHLTGCTNDYNRSQFTKTIGIFHKGPHDAAQLQWSS